jgi:hypothetical protein
MSSGILLASLFTIAVSQSDALIFGDSISNPALQLPLGPWTPPQYSQPALTMLTVTTVVPAESSVTSLSTNLTGSTDSNGVTTFSTGTLEQTNTSTVVTNYVFDAVFKLLHKRTVKKTSHPVLTGVNISDHAYVLPTTVTLEIGMSDAMTSYDAGVWVGASTKSISAWQIIKQLQLNRTLFTLQTRLDVYLNMLIVDVISPDDNRTEHGLRATITLEELISASVSSTPSQSARSQTSDTTSLGVLQTTIPNVEQLIQHQELTPYQWPQIPGAGTISSNGIDQVTGS